jgi:hypothetical protein
MSTKIRVTLFLCLTLAVVGALAQSAGAQEQVFSSSGISVNSVNGQTVVTWNGKQVFSGATNGQVFARSSNVNGTQYAAAFDGDTLIWESSTGAAQQVGSGQGSPAGFDSQKFMGELQKRMEEQKKFIGQQQQNFQGQGNSFSFGNGSSFSSSGGISVRSVNGETVVIYQGKEIPIGQTKGRVFAKSKSVNGVDYVAVFDGDQVVWENVPGAAEQFK